MATTPELPADAHDKLGTIAHFLMGAASVIHDGAAFYLKSRNKSLAAELADARAGAAELAEHAYHLGRAHQAEHAPMPEDLIAAAAAAVDPLEAAAAACDCGAVHIAPAAAAAAHYGAGELGHQDQAPAAAAE